MYNISLFVEDRIQEDFIVTLIQRFAETYQATINITPHSVRGGSGTVITELRHYQRDLQRNQEDFPDLIIVGTDSNCKGFLERENEIDQVTSDFTDLVIIAIPEPHIERWLLLDSAAFKTVFGRGCPTPDQKCEQDRYKRMLLNAISEAGVTPPIGGIEQVGELVNAMNLQRVAQNDRSIRRFLSALHRQFRNWQQTEN